MMAGFGVSGVLLLVMLTGVSSRPAKGSYYSNSYTIDPARASRFEVPPPPSVLRQPGAAPYSSNSFAAPENPGYASSSSEESTHPTFFRENNWDVPPPNPLSGKDTYPRPTAQELPGPSNVRPPGPEFKAGELSKYAEIYEHGNYDSETEEQGFQAPPPVEVYTGEDVTSGIQPSGPDASVARHFYPYPFAYLFLTGQYPPGTVTHSSNSFEQGRDHFQDTHYIRDYPASPSIQQVKTFPADFEVPQSPQQPSQPVRQTLGSTSYGQSGAATGPNQPYRAVGWPGSYQMGAYEPRRRNPASGYSARKVGY